MGFFDFLAFESQSKGILYLLWLHFGGIISALSQLLFHMGILKLPQNMCNDQNLSQTTQQSKCQERQQSSFEESGNVVVMQKYYVKTHKSCDAISFYLSGSV